MAVFYFHFLLCIAMTATVWFMQVVHYPLMAYADPARWTDFAEKRRMWTTMITYPLMAFEALTGFTLILLATQSPTYPYLAVSLILLVALIVYTFMYLNPQLKNLTGPLDEAGHKRFLKLHWIRTAGWSLRLVLFILMVLASA